MARDGVALREGAQVGVAVGGAVIGTGEVGEPAGVVVPVEAAVVPALSRHGGAIVLGPGLKDKRGTGVENVGAVLKVLKGEKIADHDVHVDASFPHDDAGGEGIGIAAAVAAVSALESIPVRQDCVVVGDLAVSGALKPVHSTLQRVEAAASLGFRKAIVPAALQGTLLVDEHVARKIQIVYSDSLLDVLAHVLDASPDAMSSITGRLVTQ